MASTISLQRVIDYCRTYTQLRPLVGIGNIPTSPLEPALTIGDWTRQFMLAPPLAWRWNRTVVQPIPLVAGTFDYKVTGLSNFGWIEKAKIVDPTTKQNKELVAVPTLMPDLVTNEPTYISPIADDGQGNITFRFSPTPYQQYDAYIIYQNAAPSFSALSQTWAPIPDYLYYLYSEGALVKAYDLATDERFSAAFQIFMRDLVAVNDGMTDMQKNLFMQNTLATQREVADKLGNRGQGQQPQQRQ